MGDEQVTFVVYDLVSNKYRKKVADRCRDYGLKRFQYSNFVGKINAGMRKKLFREIVELVKESKQDGRILAIPVCERDYERTMSYEDAKSEKEGD